MNNIQKNFKRKASGMIHGPAGKDKVHGVSLSAGEAVLPQQTVQKMGGAARIASLIRETTGKEPKHTLRSGAKYADGAIDMRKMNEALIETQHDGIMRKAFERPVDPAAVRNLAGSMAKPVTPSPAIAPAVPSVAAELPPVRQASTIADAAKAASALPQPITPVAAAAPLSTLDTMKSLPGRAWDAAKRGVSAVAGNAVPAVADAATDAVKAAAPVVDAAPTAASAMDKAAQFGKTTGNIAQELTEGAIKAGETIKEGATAGARGAGTILAGGVNLLNKAAKPLAVAQLVNAARDTMNTPTLANGAQMAVDAAGAVPLITKAGSLASAGGSLLAAADLGSRGANMALGSPLENGGLAHVVTDILSGGGSKLAWAKANRSLANDPEMIAMRNAMKPPVVAPAAPAVAAPTAINQAEIDGWKKHIAAGGTPPFAPTPAWNEAYKQSIGTFNPGAVMDAAAPAPAASAPAAPAPAAPVQQNGLVVTRGPNGERVITGVGENAFAPTKTTPTLANAVGGNGPGSGNNTTGTVWKNGQITTNNVTPMKAGEKETSNDTFNRLQADVVNAARNGNLDEQRAANRAMKSHLLHDQTMANREHSQGQLKIAQVQKDIALGQRQHERDKETVDRINKLFDDRYFDEYKTKDGELKRTPNKEKTNAFRRFFDSAIPAMESQVGVPFAQWSPTRQAQEVDRMQMLYEVAETAGKVGGVQVPITSESGIGAGNPSLADAMSPAKGTPTLANKLFGWKVSGGNDWVKVGDNVVREHQLTTDDMGVNSERKRFLRDAIAKSQEQMRK